MRLRRITLAKIRKEECEKGLELFPSPFLTIHFSPQQQLIGIHNFNLFIRNLSD